ncbi:ATP-binding protein [Methylobacterium durans]|uniref:Oxidoreductase n=1 Tax=Methylobacterium durans TaxID=2202825 RepID=A0A2U8WCG8_9HYPH|nr:ATP-binding protein [Methylobacterium durans]AWN43140.1 oxidoreductase [Methylobacterium durans]
MAISWDQLTQKKRPRPPVILEYGPEKAGKTTLASEFPNPVFLQTEEGDGVLDIASMGKIESFEDLMSAIGMLYEREHEFQTVVVDSVTALQPIIWAETGERGDDKGNKKKRIEDFGYGKGYVYALAVWQEVLDGLNALRRDRGMTIILIAHSKIERFDDPETVGYSRYEIDLHDKARDFLKREADVVLLVKPDVTVKSEEAGFNKTRAIGQGGRSVWMHATSRPAYAAGNRYGLPEKTLYEPGKGFDALAPFFPHLATADAARIAAE